MRRNERVLKHRKKAEEEEMRQNSIIKTEKKLEEREQEVKQTP